MGMGEMEGGVHVCMGMCEREVCACVKKPLGDVSDDIFFIMVHSSKAVYAMVPVIQYLPCCVVEPVVRENFTCYAY